MKTWMIALIAVAARVALKIVVDRWFDANAFYVDVLIGSAIAASSAVLWREWRSERRYFQLWEDDIRNGLQILVGCATLEEDPIKRRFIEAALRRMKQPAFSNSSKHRL